MGRSNTPSCLPTLVSKSRCQKVHCNDQISHITRSRFSAQGYAAWCALKTLPAYHISLMHAVRFLLYRHIYVNTSINWRASVRRPEPWFARLSIATDWAWSERAVRRIMRRMRKGSAACCFAPKNFRHAVRKFRQSNPIAGDTKSGRIHFLTVTKIRNAKLQLASFSDHCLSRKNVSSGKSLYLCFSSQPLYRVSSSDSARVLNLCCGSVSRAGFRGAMWISREWVWKMYK